jgi:uncharacterized protein (DUF1697 family)
MSHYVALLRGINVGGKNLIKMADLKACFETLGFENVQTYIQSGNVIFSGKASEHANLEKWLEDALSKKFSYDSMVVVRSDEELRATVAQAPQGFGSEPAAYRYDVIFLKTPLNATEAMSSITTKEGVDQAFGGEGVLYFSRLNSKATQSRLSRIMGLPIYQNMTIRNWNTTTKLLSMMEKPIA